MGMFELKNGAYKLKKRCFSQWLPLVDRLRTDLMGEVMRMGEKLKAFSL